MAGNGTRAAGSKRSSDQVPTVKMADRTGGLRASKSHRAEPEQKTESRIFENILSSLMHN
jgi:hypothetical protein